MYRKMRHGSSEYRDDGKFMWKHVSWNREKKLLMSSSDFGKDLYGVQRLIRNHDQLEDELVTHETTLRVSDPSKTTIIHH